MSTELIQSSPPKIILNLTQELYDDLEQLANRKSTDIITILQDAISLELWVQDQIKDGNRILVGKNKKLREMVLPR